MVTVAIRGLGSMLGKPICPHRLYTGESSWRTDGGWEKWLAWRRGGSLATGYGLTVTVTVACGSVMNAGIVAKTEMLPAASGRNATPPLATVVGE